MNNLKTSQLYMKAYAAFDEYYNDKITKERLREIISEIQKDPNGKELIFDLSDAGLDGARQAAIQEKESQEIDESSEEDASEGY